MLLSLVLSGCGSTGQLAQLAHEESLNRAEVNAPLPGVQPIRATPSVPLRRLSKTPTDTLEPEAFSTARIGLFASTRSQAHLMKLGADPTTGTRIWENYLRASELPYVRLANASDLARLVPTALLILPSAVVLSETEKAAILQWRNRGGSVLSTWLTGTQSETGADLGYGFMRDVLDVEVVGTTQDEVDDTFMMVHGDDPISHTLAAGTRVWMERVPKQLPLRLVGKQEAAQVMSWARSYDARKPSGLISYNERRMPSGKYSRTVTLGYPEQTWLRSDTKLLRALTGDIFAWLLRQPRVYLGAWPYPYQSGFLLAVQAAEQMSEGELRLAKAVREMGGRATFYVHGGNADKAVPTIKKIQALGHEVGYLGDSFEPFTGQTVPQQAQRMDAMQGLLSQAGIPMPRRASFAAPLDAYDAITQQLLKDRRFDNYIAGMDATESRLPTLVGWPDNWTTPLVALPRTMQGPEDRAEAGMEDFLGGLDVSVRMGGLSLVRIPAQPLLVSKQRKRLLDTMAALQDRAWIASASQVAQWWRNRAEVAVKLVPHPQGFLLTATVTDTVNTQEPLAIWVTLPQRNSRVRLQPVASDEPPPAVMAVDAMRSALILRAPQSGTYQWILSFEQSTEHEHF
ncbi:polysaccharide deacetylase family protein [Rhodoferax aquaticus]|uniref:NodB homology domain-containing protein n=1 Tax=Rhodoferax aquaticus TaxID=2527691 RepID=A0A515EKY4_9BURK|nr:polysaccharide deacetylase family protein [Rhodoferax aquaticus]QDL53323.1 hypothetical protein EXZ61_03550 [Rhodoferax aquaticus]